MTAYFLSKAYEAKFGGIWNIALPPKDSFEHEFPEQGTDDISLFERVLEIMVDQAHPIDIAITQDGKAAMYQLKRFHDGTSSEFITFVNGLAMKYAKNDICLLLVIGSQVAYHPDDVISGINFLKFPFKKLMFTYAEGERKIRLGEFFPERGSDVFQY